MIMRKYLFLLIALCLQIAARGQTSLADIDLSGLPKPTQAKALRFWFDDDAESVKTYAVSGSAYTLDVANLTDGLHTLHCQVVDTDGQTAYVSSDVFLKMRSRTDTTTVTANKLVYWFDDETTFQTVAMDGGIQQIDASRLSDGLHTVHYLVQCSDGQLTMAASAVFLRMNIDKETTVASSLRYWFDDDASTVRTTNVSGGTQMLDVNDLQAGLHTLNYQLIDSEGKVGIPVTRIFMKNFGRVSGDGQYFVTKYKYWLNSNTEGVKTAEVESTANPYTLYALLPVEQQPIRSECFHFEVTDGQPTVYAKNDFHVRFFGSQGYIDEGERKFVDYSVKVEVTDIELLESGVRATMAKPADNAIKWYKVEAERGDSLQFKLNRAATIQLFAPSGELLFSASGAESTQWGGCHAKEDGTFYLALHDVTAQQGNTVSIDYNHIDKYAVLRQNVMFVGNGGCSTITFEGNGFRDLYAVDLYNAQGDTIKHVYIGHESDATTSVAFDFTDAVLGQYDVLFRFVTEDKRFPVHVTVEEPKDIELATTVTFPSGFPHGLSTTYTVKITNKGNMTAYSVPIYTYIMNKRNKNGIYHIEYDGLDLPGVFDGVDMDSLSANERAELQALSEEMGDGHYFMLFRTVDEDSSNDSVWVRSNYFFTNIAPYETKTLQLTLSADEGVWAYFTVPEDWSAIYDESKNTPQAARACIRKKNVASKYCCYRDKVECVFNLISDGTTVFNLVATLDPSSTVKTTAAVADCVAGIVKQAVSSLGHQLCDDNTTPQTPYDRIKGVLNGISITGMLSSCASGLIPFKDINKLKKLGQLVNGIGIAAGGASTAFGTGFDGFECVKSLFSKVPGCPPTPSNGGASGGGLSWDPNDIYGYLSESGSKFMTDSVTMMNYTIEFENDTAFATAAAYKVVVCDTLDGRYFDLASYAPMSVRIGSKQANLDGSQNFVTTVDMRPEINAIAQVEGTYDVQKGIMTWTFTSIDPMTMEPATDIMQGFLPVNYNGNGIGDVSYVVSKKTGLAHGTEISNRASITFDVNEPILTPTWTNIIDRIAPESCVADVQLLNDSTATVSIEATDELSGPWRYDVYVQYGSGAWFKAAENVPADTTASVKVYEGIDHGFYVVVTDSAGNVEQKEAAREFSLSYNAATTVTGDVNGDEAVNGGDVMAVYNSMAGGATNSRSDVNGDGAVNGGDVMAVYDIMAGGKGSVRAFYRKQRKANNIRQRHTNVKQ